MLLLRQGGRSCAARSSSSAIARGGWGSSRASRAVTTSFSATTITSSSLVPASSFYARLASTTTAAAEPPVAVNRSARKRYVRHPWNDSESVLSDDLRILTYLAGNTAAGNLSAVGRDWCYLDPAKHAAGMDVILQTLVFAGVPKMYTVSELGVDDRRILESTFPEGEDFKEPVGYGDFIEKGEAEMHLAFSHKYPRLRERMAELHPALDKWMVDTVWGRLRSRTSLASKERQLCALAALAGNIVWPQFKSSIIVALNSGCSLDEVRSVLDQTEKVWGTSAQIMVDALWTDLNKKALHSWQDATCENSLHNHGRGHIPSSTPVPANNTNHAAKFTTTSKHPFMYLNRMEDAIPHHLRVLALLAAHTASGNLTRVGVDWSYLSEEHHAAGLEVILQSTIFGGFQKSINALQARPIPALGTSLRSWSIAYPPCACEQVVRNIGVSPTAIDYAAEEAPEDRRVNVKRGTELLKLIYQKQYPRLREKMRWMHSDVEKVIVEWAYGRVLARPSTVLAPKDRELCALACLSGQIVFPQLHSHILGALNAGARLEEIRAIFDQTEYVWGKDEQIMVDGFWLDFAQHYNYHKQTAAAKKEAASAAAKGPAKQESAPSAKNDAGSVFTG